jgi:hypothetical protein
LSSEIDNHSEVFPLLDYYRVIQKRNAETLLPGEFRGTAKELYSQGWKLSYKTSPTYLAYIQSTLTFQQAIEAGLRKFIIDSEGISVFEPLSQEDLDRKAKYDVACRKEYTPFGKNLVKIPVQFEQDVIDFENYLRSTSTLKFKINSRIVFKGNNIGGFQCEGKEIFTEKWVPYVHRWTKVYRNSLLAKLYLLEEYCNENPELLQNITMITLTVSQRGKDQEEALRDLMKNYKKLFDVLRHEFGAVDYFYILEPHKTGYAHMHVLYFKLFSEEEKRHIWNLWENKYGAGNHEAFNFSIPKASEDKRCKEGSIEYIRAYVMKYVSKSLRLEKMSKKVLLFNALLKKTKIRLWNCSRHLSQVMRQKKEVSDVIEEYECLSVELHDDELGDTEKDTFVRQIYPKPLREEFVVIPKEQTHLREAQTKNHSLTDFTVQVDAIKDKISQAVTFVKSKCKRLKHLHKHEKHKKITKKILLNDFDVQPEDYGEVEGVTVTEDGEDMLKFLKEEGY